MSTYTKAENLARFQDARFGIFVHFGLYSLLGRGEWALNKESIPEREYRALADQFKPDSFDADDFAKRVNDAGAKYITFTTMHHDGFAMYDSKVNPFNSVNHAAGRDFIDEIVNACRKRGLGVHLYHSLNSWLTPDGIPDACEALEIEDAYNRFIDYTFARLEELVTRFNPIDCLWYDGWWPFNEEQWRAKRMNAMISAIQPHILFNGRNGLPGDFGTPEQHVSAPYPWRPWEACMTHNRSWGYHVGDTHFQPTADVIATITQCAAGAGNLLFNVGPDGEGRLPQATVDMLGEVGQWMSIHDEALHGNEPLMMDLMKLREGDRGEWFHSGHFTARGNTLYVHLLNWPGSTLNLGSVQGKAKSARLMHPEQTLELKQDDRRIVVTGLPETAPLQFGGVVAIEYDGHWRLYQTGGLRIPNVPHPRYDPLPSDLPH